MNILIIGGGRQLGTLILNKLSVIDGYEIDIFNRGSQNYSDLIFSNHYIGDRNIDFQIINKKYDCIIDLCAYDYKLSKKSIHYFINSTSKYIFISSSYIHHYLFPNIYLINLNVLNKKILYNYAKNKYEIENYIKENYKISHILRSVPLISNIDHTQRTETFIKCLKNKKIYNDIFNQFIQLNSAYLFTDLIIKKIIDNKSSIVDISGNYISIKKIFNKLNIVFDKSNFFDLQKNNIPFLDFNCKFPGNKISENHIIQIFQNIYINNF